MRIPAPADLLFEPLLLDRQEPLVEQLAGPNRSDAGDGGQRSVRDWLISPLSIPVGVALIIALLPFLVAYYLYRLVWQKNWLLTPGGIIVRQGSIFSRSNRVTPVRSSDALPVLVRNTAHNFTAELWEKKRRHRIGMGIVEAAALLAVWQPPHRVAAADQAVDLQ